MALHFAQMKDKFFDRFGFTARSPSAERTFIVNSKTRALN